MLFLVCLLIVLEFILDQWFQFSSFGLNFRFYMKLVMRILYLDLLEICFFMVFGCFGVWDVDSENFQRGSSVDVLF